MKTLEALWNEGQQNTNEKLSRRFRFVDWNHQTRFFTVKNISNDGLFFEGVLDCGTKISFPKDSDFWIEYQDGDEDSPRAV